MSEGMSESMSESVICTPRAVRRSCWARRLVLRMAPLLQEGRLTIDEGIERHTFEGRHGDGGLDVTLYVHDGRFYNSLLFGGNVGVGESYMAGHWSCDDLVALVRLITRNGSLFVGLDQGWMGLLRPLNRLRHLLNHNSLRNARRNIAAHYDLGNDFYRMMLDETMTYSSALFPTRDTPLQAASTAKLDRMCQKLALTPRDHVLEIGSGWGSFALHAAQHYGCRVTTTTISPAQFEEVNRRVAEAGLGERITVLQQDYRTLRGTYDKLVSIEMIEAVGHQYFDAFFRTCAARLKPDGMMGLQAILASDQLFDRYKDKPDFINRYIFPGGCLPSMGAIMQSIGRATDLRVHHLESLAEHYALTVMRWRENFHANLDAVRAMRFDERFVRMWELYLSFCAGAFAERRIGVAQIVFAKPRNRQGTPALDGVPALPL